MFFAKIERESTSFTNYHLKQGTTYQIGMCCDPVVVHRHPFVKEVKSHLTNFI